MFLSNVIPNINTITSIDDFLEIKVEGDKHILIAATEKISQAYNIKLMKYTQTPNYIYIIDKIFT